MDVDWALLGQEFYMEAVIYTAVATGLHALLADGADDSAVGRLGEQCRFPAKAIVEVLGTAGLVQKDAAGRWRWERGAPSAEMVNRMDAVRRWVTLSTPRAEHLASWKRDADDERLSSSGAAINNFVMSVMHPQAGCRWLDIGGGTAELAGTLARSGVQVTVMDTPPVISRMRSQAVPGLTLYAGDALKGLPRGKFGVISAVRFIEDFTSSQVRQLLKTMRSSLAHGGSICLVSSLDDDTLWAKLFAVEISSINPNGRIYSERLLRVLAARERLAVALQAHCGPYALMVLRPARVARRSRCVRVAPRAVSPRVLVNALL